MSDDKFDVIIVGAGVAGSTAGYILAKAGLNVLMIERGNKAGAKNMTGGRLYSSALEKIIPNFAEEAAVERKVLRERVSFMTEESATTLDFMSNKLGVQGKDSYTVVRARFDEWLAGKAEEAGVNPIYGIRVDELVMRDGKVCGVKAGDDELEADVVILADGSNSILGEKLGMVKRFTPSTIAVGAKEVLELPREVIQQRFNLGEKDGMAWLAAGYASANMFGGGLIYTNLDTVSVGIVAGLHGIEKAKKTVPEMLDDFKAHPAVAPYLKDAKLVEYSGHTVPEGGLNMIPKIVGNGVVIVGDAAGMCINVGYTVRGMDLAIASAEAAANAIIDANKAGNFSEATLSKYQRNLDSSFVMKDLKLYKNLPGFLEHTTRIFSGYPEMVEGIMLDMFTMDGQPQKSLLKKALAHVKKVGILNIAKDAFKGVRSI